MNKSHRDIKGERLTDPSKVANNAKKHDIKPIQAGKKPQYNPTTMDRAKKAFDYVKKTVAGQNRLGEGIHGVLDLLPIPNQIIAKAVSYFTEGDVYKATDELRKLLSVRNGIALVAFILFVTGLISLEDMRELLKAIGNFL